MILAGITLLVLGIRSVFASYQRTSSLDMSFIDQSLPDISNCCDGRPWCRESCKFLKPRYPTFREVFLSV